MDKLREGMRIRDAQGRVHEVDRVTRTDGLSLLHINRDALHSVQEDERAIHE